MPSIDPLTDRKAAELDQDKGRESRPGNIRRFGRDPAHVDAEREADDFQEPQAQQTLPFEAQPNDEDADDEV